MNRLLNYYRANPESWLLNIARMLLVAVCIVAYAVWVFVAPELIQALIKP